MIPIATTTIAVLRSDQDGTQDAIDGVTLSTLATGVRAVIGSDSGTETNAGGSSEQVSARLDCDPTDLRHVDQVTDEATGETWHVTWVRRRRGMGLDHMEAGLLAITDRAGV